MTTRRSRDVDDHGSADERRRSGDTSASLNRSSSLSALLDTRQSDRAKKSATRAAQDSPMITRASADVGLGDEAPDFARLLVVADRAAGRVGRWALPASARAPTKTAARAPTSSRRSFVRRFLPHGRSGDEPGLAVRGPAPAGVPPSQRRGRVPSLMSWPVSGYTGTAKIAGFKRKCVFFRSRCKYSLAC